MSISFCALVLFPQALASCVEPAKNEVYIFIQLQSATVPLLKEYLDFSASNWYTYTWSLKFY